MNMKDFFRPTSKKIIILLILLFIFELLMFNQGYSHSLGIECPEPGCGNPADAGISNVISSILDPGIILIIVIFYIVSCILVSFLKILDNVIK